jgi:hypothetical protein
VNEDQVPKIILTGFAVVRDHDESTEKRKRSEFRKRMMMNPQMKRKITLHQSRYFSEPSGLETPSKYEY